MIESGNNKEFINKKCYEVAYALYRIAAYASDVAMAKRIKDGASDVLACVVSNEYGKAANELQVLDYMIRLAADTDSIHVINADVVMREIGNLYGLIAEGVREQERPVDISSLFLPDVGVEISRAPQTKRGVDDDVVRSSVEKKDSGDTKDNSRGSGSLNRASEDFFVQKNNRQEWRGVERKISNPTEVATDILPQKTNLRVQGFESRSESKSGNSQTSGFLKSGMRQIAIIDKIRQSGNCRLKDIQEILPDSSERTIRYDLEDLIERNLIERIGNGGPAVQYRMRQK